MPKIGTLIIPWGLPASGKTTFLKGLNVKFINCDNGDFKLLKNLDDCEALAIDILITTNAQCLKFLNILKEFISWECLVIHFWEENRSACLHNDSFRPKERSAFLTIQTAKFETPNPKFFKEYLIKIEKHQTNIFYQEC